LYSFFYSVFGIMEDTNMLYFMKCGGKRDVFGIAEKDVSD
jgi:hypothetical protein